MKRQKKKKTLAFKNAVAGYLFILPFILGFILFMVSPVKMLIYLLLVLVLQQFDGLYLGPKILGDSTGLRPAWIIFSVSAGGAVCGALGMFLGVPVLAVIGHLLNIWIDYRLKKKTEILLEEDESAAAEPDLPEENI